MSQYEASPAMAVIKMFFAAAILGVMLGTIPAQDVRMDKVEQRVFDQAEKSARMEQQIQQMSTQIARLVGLQEAAFVGLVGLLGKDVLKGLMLLSRRNKE